MNNFQKFLLVNARKCNNELPAPKYQLSLDEARSYCGLQNTGLADVERDYSLRLTLSGKSRADDILTDREAIQ